PRRRRIGGRALREDLLVLLLGYDPGQLLFVPADVVAHARQQLLRLRRIDLLRRRRGCRYLDRTDGGRPLLDEPRGLVGRRFHDVDVALVAAAEFADAFAVRHRDADERDGLG